MILNDFRLAFRHLWRRKIYTLVILLSLTVGFASTSLLVSFLIAETNTDSFHTQASRTFQLLSNDYFDGEGDMAYVPDFFAEYLKENYPEVEQVVQVANLNVLSLETDTGEFHDIKTLSVDSSFFSIFSYPIYKGSTSHALTSESIILSKEKAQVLFGDTDVVGKLLTLKTADTTRSISVSAVLEKSPENSHLVFDALVSHSLLKNKFQGGASYVLLNESQQQKTLQDKLSKDTRRPSLIGQGVANYSLEPLSTSYFNVSNTFPYMKTRSTLVLRVGAVVCALVFFMASFNFISLFLLSLQDRKKEAGIRKTLGISFWNLIKSSSIEIVIYIAIAFMLSLVLIAFILPSFNDVLETSLAFEYMSRMEVLLSIGGIVFVLGLMVVIFSVAQQRRVQPVSLMRNATVSKITFSKSLFTVQFVISITLVICATTIIRQMDFIESAPLGFNRNILLLPILDKSMSKKLPVLKQKMATISGVGNVTSVNGTPVSGSWRGRYDLEDHKFYTPFLFSGDEDFMQTLDLALLEGEFPSATNKGKLVNEELVNYFEMKNPIGQKIPGTEDLIIGIVKDFTCSSFKEEIAPAIISYSQDNSRLLIDYSGQNLSSLLPQIQKEWNNIFPDYHFSYQVIQEELMKKYKGETFFYKTVVAFSITSMIISCFGLFALSWAVAQSRLKEMGIRKVLGATSKDIMNLLTLSFVKRICIAFCIAAPAGYYLMDKWLQNFANRISINFWIFIIAGMAVTFIALLTMSIQTVKAALTNPVHELKNE